MCSVCSHCERYVWGRGGRRVSLHCLHRCYAFLLPPWPRALISFTDDNYYIFQQFLCVISEKAQMILRFTLATVSVEGCGQFAAKAQHCVPRQNADESFGPSWAKLLRLSTARTVFFADAF